MALNILPSEVTSHIVTLVVVPVEPVHNIWSTPVIYNIRAAAHGLNGMETL